MLTCRHAGLSTFYLHRWLCIQFAISPSLPVYLLVSLSLLAPPPGLLTSTPPPSCSDLSSFYKLSFWSCRVNRFSHVLLLSDWCQYWDQLWLTLTQLQILHLIINLWWVIRVHWEVLLCVLLQWVQVKSQYNRYDINIEWIHLYKRLLLTALLYDSDQPLVKMSEAMTCDTFWSALHCLLNPFHIYNW